VVGAKVALEAVVTLAAVFLKVDTIAVPILVLILPENKHWELPKGILEVLVAFQAILILLKLLPLEEAKGLDLLM